jgi:hypothetical protein
MTGTLSKAGALSMGEELAALLQKTKLKRILFNTAELNPTAIHQVFGIVHESFSKLGEHLEVTASYVPNLKIFALSRFVSFLHGRKNHRAFRTREGAIHYLNHYQSLATVPSQDIFRYSIALTENYITCKISGIPNKEGISLITEEILAWSRSSGIRKLYLDANEIKPFYSSLGQGIKYFRIITPNIDQGCSSIANYKVYALGRFIELVTRTKNWKTFITREEAIKWLLRDSAGAKTRR